MTPDTLGPCPPRKFLIHSDPATRGLHWVNHDYADYWRRRAERAEALLRLSTHYDDHEGGCRIGQFPEEGCTCGFAGYRARVAAHFDSINSKGDDKCRTE